MSTITPVKPGRSIRHRNKINRDDSVDFEQHHNFTSPDFKVNPSMISYKRNYQTTAKKVSNTFKSSEKLDKPAFANQRQQRNIADTASFIKKAPKFNSYEQVDLYEGNLKEYTNVDTTDIR